VRATASDMAPPILNPKVTVKENKGDDSVSLSMPWQCNYCAYLDVACPGALVPVHRDRGIAAKISKKTGELYPTDGNDDVLSIVTRYINSGGSDE
jgi:hypothetical protein